MKLSDAVFEFLSKQGVDQCFAVSGGAAAHLFDSIGKSRINVVHMHHEQACAMAADGYARVARKPALVLVTNGPGVSNTITGVLGAFQDSVPMIIISGQVPTKQMLSNGGGVQRQFGVQEVETASLVRSVVKKIVCLTDPSQLTKALNQSWVEATTGRPGPVWIEIPLDIQSEQVNSVEVYQIPTTQFDSKYDEVKLYLKESLKPLIVIGGGIHLSNAEIELIDFSRKTGIPVVSTWGANDVFHAEDDLYVGNFGILGTRIANYAVQKADLLIILGTRLSIPNLGYEPELFSPNSIKIMVNLDESEMSKKSISIQLPIRSDLKQWLGNYSFDEPEHKEEIAKWCQKLNDLKQEYGLSVESYSHEEGCLDSYRVVEELSQSIASQATLVTDMGASFTCTMQSFKNLRDTRLFTSCGTSSMGFGLPGAIGAYFANKARPIYLIAGDGGFQMNIQEMQTIKFHGIPIRILILNSNGYLAISIMQSSSFKGNYVGSNPDSGIDAPDFCKVVNGYGIDSHKVGSESDLSDMLKAVEFSSHPILLEIKIPSSQLMRPRSQSLVRENGSFYSQGLEIMWPYLSAADIESIENKLK
jgi:acetolactate synthase I/II/III large subunit